MMMGLFFMIVELWSVCFLSKTYAEMLQDHANDESDSALVDFVWQRRGETWAKLEKFEDVVQRQFEELRMSLVAHDARSSPGVTVVKGTATLPVRAPLGVAHLAQLRSALARESGADATANLVTPALCVL